MTKSIIIQKQKLLLVEGVDDKDFFIVLLDKVGITDVQIISVDGKTNFKSILQIVASIEGFSLLTHIGVVRDADTHAKGAFESIANSLTKIGLTPPSKGDTFRVDDIGVSVGIFIMPRKFEEGMLEDLCMESVRKHTIIPCIDDFVKCIEKNLTTAEQPKNVSKMKSQVFLAAMPEMVNSIGLGAKKGYWDFDDSCMDDIKDFLKNFIQAHLPPQ